MASIITSGKETTGRIGRRRQVTIPRDIFEKLNLRAGDTVAFAERRGTVVVKPKQTASRDDILTPDEAAIVRRGEAQLKSGESKAWRDVKDALAR